MTAPRILVVLSTAVLAIGLLATPAMAAPVSVSDPAGDGVGPGDIRGVRLGFSGYMHVRVRTKEPIDIETSPAWVRGTSVSILRANLDVDDDPAVDFAAVMEAGSGEVALTLRNYQPMPSPSPRILCIDVVQPQPTIIDLLVNPHCTDSAEHFRAFVRYRLDRGGDGSLDSDDRGPNAGFTPVLQFIF